VPPIETGSGREINRLDAARKASFTQAARPSDFFRSQQTPSFIRLPTARLKPRPFQRMFLKHAARILDRNSKD
jgi:hypothetical protein